jgi:thioredoxin 1
MIKNLNYLDFHESIKKGVCLVDYWAFWCIPCLTQDPILEEIEKEIGHKALIAKVDINDNKVIAHQQRVRNIPTLILYKEGQEIERFSGIQSKEIIINSIEKNLNS